jgi:hypothetical protein
VTRLQARQSEPDWHLPLQCGTRAKVPSESIPSFER